MHGDLHGVHSVAFTGEALPVAALLPLGGGAARRTATGVHRQVPVWALLPVPSVWDAPVRACHMSVLRGPEGEKAM